MAQVNVRVFRKGQEITRITRPLRHVDGKPVVKYKNRFWSLINEGRIYLDSDLPSEDETVQEVSDTDGPDHAPEFVVVPPNVIQWDRSQRKVIYAPQEDRWLVGAGPGTGKTEVACARISKLIDQDGLEASRIWLISFTRTAVREVHDRIAAHLEDEAAAHAVKIATLDAHAWTIHSGFDDEAKILGSYEENIEEVIRLIREEESVSEYLNTVEHMVVDEAQDIVGVRADLVIDIVGRLSSSCGITVFSDEAQAIYGFADDSETQSGEFETSITLSEKIRNGTVGPFRKSELVEVHRTSSQRLLKIFSDTRRKVLAAGGESENKLVDITNEISSLAHGTAPSIDAGALAELEDAFVLYRRRCDVLLTSSILTQNRVKHRVRMSGLPVCLMPWIGAALSEYAEADLSKSVFEELWDKRVCGTPMATYNCDVAWAGLVQIAGRTRAVVEMHQLRQRLGRKQPPAELCHPELGLRGPIIGTIHASKGREADTVHLMLPVYTSQNVDQDEEARVVFVGATRGRSQLLVGPGYRQSAGRVESSGRAYSLKTRDKKPRAQVEFGRSADIGAEGLAGRAHFPSGADVRASQSRIQSIANESVPLVAECDRSSNFAFRLREDGAGPCLAVLSRGVNDDLFVIANAVQKELGGVSRRPPDRIRHLHTRGVRTIVLPPDAPESEILHEPWRSSGIILAPMILGYSTVFLPSRNRKRR